MSTIFDKYFKRFDSWYEKNRPAYLSELRVLRKVIPKEGKGLEIGVGTARFAAPLKITFGIDPSEKMVEIARQRGVDARIGYGERLPFKRSFFDYAAIIITLCFVEDPDKVLEETRRVLKTNGKIIVGIVDKKSFLGKFYRFQKSVFYKEANFFGVGEVTNMLLAARFKNCTYYQTLFKLPQEVRSVERPERGFGKGGFVTLRADRA